MAAAVEGAQSGRPRRFAPRGGGASARVHHDSRT